MWIVGLVLGLALGGLMESFAAALLLGVVGAFFLPFILKDKKPGKNLAPKTLASGAGTAQLPRVTAPTSDVAEPDLVAELQLKVIQLERRLTALERRVAGDTVTVDGLAAGEPVAAAGVVDLPAQDTQRPGPDHIVLLDTPLIVSGAMPGVVLAHSEKTPLSPMTLPPGDRALPARIDVLQAMAVSASTPDISVPVPVPPRVILPPLPPPPAIPLRDRLPAPIRQLIFGGNMLVKLGVLILFLGLVFLLRYTAERVTLPIELRYAAVALVGASLLSLGWLLRHRRTSYGLVLQGAGIGVFYLTTLAAMKLSEVLPPTLGFGFLFAVAVLSAVLAVLQDAPLLAIVAALEGFAAPVLAATGENRPMGLFTYLLVLDFGIFLVAWFKAWRLLNVIGFVGTFTLAAGWAQRYYTADQYGLVQPFLLVFFLMFSTIGLLFARRTLAEAPGNETLPLAARAADTLRRVGRVDSALVFGVPMVAFGLQYLLMRPWEFGAAFSALALSAFYLLLGRLVFSTQPKGLALLAEAYAVVGVIFGTLAIPLGLEGQWTGATWAVEAAGMYWLGVRQARPYARAVSFVVLAGALIQMLCAVTVNGVPGLPLLHGSFIGPLMMAGGVFSIWALLRRARFDEHHNWESTAGALLPWVGMAALSLLPWQTLTPAWAAGTTSLMALATFAVAIPFALNPLRPIVHAMQLLAVIAFIATLHGGEAGAAALASGWQGVISAGMIALSVLTTALWSLRRAYADALVAGIPPVWSVVQIVGVVVAVGLLHLAMLFGIDLPHAALIWPFTAVILLWVAMRVALPQLAVLAGLVHVVAAGLFVLENRHGGPLPAFAHLGFWTPLALGSTALIAADWIRAQARHAKTTLAAGWVPTGMTPTTASRWVNAWCVQPAMPWVSLLWGLLWWVVASLGESLRVLAMNHLHNYQPAATVAVILLTSVVASVLAVRRDWRQLGHITIVTLPALALAAAFGLLQTVQRQTFLPPSSGLGWLMWPLALVWQACLLHAQRRWLGAATRVWLHVAGLWFFIAMVARECQWQLGQLGQFGQVDQAGELGSSLSSWSLLGWVLVPILVLWAMRSRIVLRRWPLPEYRVVYLEIAGTPIAVYLLGWALVTNVLSPGNAEPLPYVPLLNPLEMAQWLALLTLALWWQALPEASVLRQQSRWVRRGLALAVFALLSGVVLRACHHYADVAWGVDALYASTLTQAALSITWALCGVVAMVFGHRHGTRPTWMAGAALLGIVVLKLFFVELADRGGLFRIVSFIGVGALLLLVGYFAPVPPAAATLLKEKEA